jgi:hypothetical protein
LLLSIVVSRPNAKILIVPHRLAGKLMSRYWPSAAVRITELSTKCVAAWCREAEFLSQLARIAANGQ